jgi:hypothetical protein
MENGEPERLDDSTRRTEFDLPPPGLARARALGLLAVRECWDALSVAKKEARSLPSRRLKNARRKAHKATDLDGKAAGFEGPVVKIVPASPAGRRILVETSIASMPRRHRAGIPIVIPGHPEIVAFKYGNPDRDLVDAKRIIDARKRQLGID